MRVAIADIRTTMSSALKAKGYQQADIPFLIDMYLDGDLRGHTSHGLASFAGFIHEDYSGLQLPTVLKETAAFFLLDAKSNPGALVGKRAADEAILRAKKEAVGTAMIRNMDSWLRPGAIAQYIANQDMFAIVANSGGGAAVAPPGGFDDTIGTNPIAYGIPTNDDPLVVDMATAKRAWGQVRLANKYGTDLPADTFYDNEGNTTTDPKKAHSVMPFGDYKGFALGLLIEIMCGGLVGMDMMISSDAGNVFGQRMPDRGAFITVIDPSQTTRLDIFKAANSELFSRIKATRPLKEQEVRIPGEHAGSSQAARAKDGFVDIPKELWDEIQKL